MVFCPLYWNRIERIAGWKRNKFLIGTLSIQHPSFHLLAHRVCRSVPDQTSLSLPPPPRDMNGQDLDLGRIAGRVCELSCRRPDAIGNFYCSQCLCWIGTAKDCDSTRLDSIQVKREVVTVISWAVCMQGVVVILGQLLYMRHPPIWLLIPSTGWRQAEMCL